MGRSIWSAVYTRIFRRRFYLRSPGDQSRTAHGKHEAPAGTGSASDTSRNTFKYRGMNHVIKTIVSIGLAMLACITVDAAPAPATAPSQPKDVSALLAPIVKKRDV